MMSPKLSLLCMESYWEQSKVQLSKVAELDERSSNNHCRCHNGAFSLHLAAFWGDFAGDWGFWEWKSAHNSKSICSYPLAINDWFPNWLPIAVFLVDNVSVSLAFLSLLINGIYSCGILLPKDIWIKYVTTTSTTITAYSYQG